LPNRKGSFFRMNLPNKLFDFLMSGKPIVVAGEGESGDAVLAAAAGAVVQAEDSDAMAVALEGLEKLSPSERIAMGERGRAFVTRNYDREERLQTLERLLAESCGVAR
jgi:glycosyltransferase involved in cell wall biosynthesis